MRPAPLHLLFLLLALVALPDLASAAGFTCSGSGKRVEIELDVSTDAERGGAVYDALGRARIKVGGKSRYVTLEFDASHVAQYWSEEDELRLRFARRGEAEAAAAPEEEAREAEEGGDVEETEHPVGGNADLVLSARRDASTGELEGNWRLATTALDAVATGSLLCQLEGE
jgi:hypothetical protein